MWSHGLAMLADRHEKTTGQNNNGHGKQEKGDEQGAKKPSKQAFLVNKIHPKFQSQIQQP